MPKEFSPDQNRLQRRINRYLKAGIEQSWIGSKHPEEHEAILAESNAATFLLRKEISQLFDYIENLHVQKTV